MLYVPWLGFQKNVASCHIVCFLYSLSHVQSDEPLGWSQAKDRCCKANKSHTFVDPESHPNAVVCSKCVLDPIYHSVLSWSLATYRLSLRNLTCRSHDVLRNQCKIGQVVPPYLLAPCKIVFFFALGKKLSKDLGLSRKLMGILLVLMPTMSFLGGLFWSVIVDRTGSYRGVLTTTSLLGVTTIFGYLLPQAATSFSAVWWYGDGSIVISSCMNLFPGRIIIWVCSEMRYIPPIIDNYSHLIGEWWFTIGFRAMLWDKPIGFCHLGPGIPGLNPINSSVFSQGLPLLVLITLLHGSPGLQPSIFWKCHWMSVSPQRYHWGSSVVSVEEK